MRYLKELAMAIVTEGQLGKDTDTLKKMQRHFEKVPRHLQHRSPSTQATSRMNWRHTVYLYFETTRRAHMEGKRRRRKNRDPSETISEQTVTCIRFGKICLTRIGFISHQRACTRRGRSPLCAKQGHDDVDDIKTWLVRV